MDRGDVILSQDGADYIVRLDPPDASGLHPVEQRFDDIRKARGAWGGLRLVLGRRKIDLTGGANGR